MGLCLYIDLTFKRFSILHENFILRYYDQILWERVKDFYKRFEMRSRLDQKLEQLYVELIKMGSLCEEAIALCAKALLEPNHISVNKVFDLERQTDQMERGIEAWCLRLLCQEQPVARDLRAISAALRMISDMERIGDQAADIAELVPYLASTSFPNRSSIGDLARMVVRMVTESVDAFVRDDVELANQVIFQDDEVDKLFEKVKEELVQLIQNGHPDAREALDLLMVDKYFERIGDHAVNLAQWVLYSVTGVHKTSGHSEVLC